MPDERFRIPRRAWMALAGSFLCVAVVASHVVAILDGHPLDSVWWGLPLNAIGIVSNAYIARGYVRRALQKHEQRERQMHGS